jgi:hypothetical protein
MRGRRSIAVWTATVIIGGIAVVGCQEWRATTAAAVKSIHFAGYEWVVKESASPTDPGPNIFDGRNVWIDRRGRLHLKIARRDGQFTAAEIISKRSFGYGEYRFHVNASPLDPHIVLGMFTWDDSLDHPTHRELDIEISRWANRENANAQCVVQPYEMTGNIDRFEMPDGPAVHEFVWAKDLFACRSSLLHGARNDLRPIHAHTFIEGIPPTASENVRINLWLLGGSPPQDNSETEVIIEAFEFFPTSAEAQ